MYIRRKVFSQVENWDNGYEMEERLYSTGDAELDELLERAFCEGYEAAQREFGEKWDKVKDGFKNAGKKVSDTTKKYLGKEGKLATGVSGWAKKMSGKVDAATLERMVKLEDAYNQGKLSKNAYEKAMKKFENGGGAISRGTKKVLNAIERNPRTAAGIAAGTVLAGVGVGVHAAKKRKED